MRNIILQNMISLDGFFEGPDHSLDWHIVDKEFNDYSSDFLDSLDLLLFGRVTYQLMADYWPTPAAIHDDPIIAEKMNTLPKIVVSKTLERARWQNSRLIKTHVTEEVARLKLEPGKDIGIFGSSNLSLTLIQDNLIDEFRLIVNPVYLGKGRPLFSGLIGRLNLRLLRTRTFRSGNVMLIYKAFPEISRKPISWTSLLV